MRQWPSLIGQRFGKLVVTDQAESTPSGRRRWCCQCDCGNRTVVVGSNLTQGKTVSCGCSRYRDLTGQRIGLLTVLERSEQYGSRGARRTRLWKCRCECGAITYKATDTLTNPAVSMCRDCASGYGIEIAGQRNGYVAGTQMQKIANISGESDNASGIRGVYLDRKTGRYRARIRFQGKLYNLGSFSSLDAAVKARREGEEKYFGRFLAAQETSPE